MHNKQNKKQSDGGAEIDRYKETYKRRNRETENTDDVVERDRQTDSVMGRNRAGMQRNIQTYT